MRKNLPVTDVEHTFDERASIVSKTDLKGRITYVNKTFVEVSGFSEEELIGSPHNIVRHPDMPPAAFEDLWRTLKAGRPWKGMVKNRCKNGDYYWVEANANPIREDGRIIGYMSLRTKPSRAQIEAAERAYKAFREGTARGLAVREGRIVRTGIPGMLARLRNPSIRLRLSAVVLLLTITAVIGSTAALNGMRHSNQALATVYDDRLVPTGQISDILERVMENRGYLLDAVNRPTSERIRENTARIEANREQISAIWKQYMETYLTAEEKRLAERWAADRTHFVRNGLNAGIDALRDGKLEEARRIAYEVMEPAYEPVKQGAAALKQLQLEVAETAYKSASADYAATRNWIAIGLILALAAAVGVAVLIVRGITGALREAMLVAEGVSSGNLKMKIDVRREDELGRLMQSLKNMVGNLVGISNDLSTTSNRIADRARQIAQGNDSLNQRTEEQASSLEETASSMEQMTSTVKQNADNAQQANQLAMNASDQAERGGEVVESTIAAMGEINESSRRIADIIGVIDELAFQTNLLALNAAVEAARAGEQGRGFAVVAGEVRNLAQRSAESAREIKGLIEDSVSKVEQGSELVDASGRTLHEIVGGVKMVNDIVADIASASQEQSVGIEQVNKAVMQMDEMTQQNAALVEQAAEASRSLQDEAVYLARLTGFFKY